MIYPIHILGIWTKHWATIKNAFPDATHFSIDTKSGPVILVVLKESDKDHYAYEIRDLTNPHWFNNRLLSRSEKSKPI